jgi:hypothetical protein
MLTLKIGRRSTHQVATIEEASRTYAQARDASGEGASTFPTGTISAEGGKPKFRVSYNAKVWDGDVVAYNPYA